MNCQVCDCNEYANTVLDVYKNMLFFVHVCNKHYEMYREIEG